MSDAAAAAPGGRTKLCIVPHMGLGDMIILNGMVRAACAMYEEVLLFAKKRYANSLRCLIGDLPNLRLKFVGDDLQADEFATMCLAITSAGFALMPMGVHTRHDWRSLDPIWSRALYRQVGLDPDVMYDGFRVARNADREALLLDRVCAAVGVAYVVVHDDPCRGYVIDRGCLPKGVPVVHVDDVRWRSDNIFDYAQVIDNALAFHGFDSCFMLMADFLRLGRQNVCHAYLKDANMPQAFYRSDIALLRAPPPPA